MQPGTEMNYEELRAEAARLVAESDKSQIKIGEELDVSSGAISRAISETGSKFANLQRRIIRLLTPYRVEEEVTFRVREDP